MTTIVDLGEVESKTSLNPIEDSNPKNLSGELDGDEKVLDPSNKLSFKNLSVKQLYFFLWNNMRSWGSFVDSSKMKLPTATMQWSKRFVSNLDYFRTNYISIFVILLIYCILTSPFLLLILGATSGSSYLLYLKNKESPIQILGYQPSLKQQYIGIAIVALPLFWFVGVGSTVFWVIGASLFVIGLHASLYANEGTNEENKQNDLFSSDFPPYLVTETV